MSWIIAALAAALNADPALAGGPDDYYGEAAAYKPARSIYGAPHEARPRPGPDMRQPYALHERPYDARFDARYDAPYAQPHPAPHEAHAPVTAYRSVPAPRPVQLSPDFFYGSLSGGVERPPVQFYPVRHGYVIHHAPSGPVSAGQAAAARGLGQGKSN